MSKKVRSSSTKGKTEEKAAPPPTKKSGAEPVILASGNYEINQVGFDDMTKMDDMTLDAVLENLKDRYAVDTIYTFTATILTAINPYKNLPIYDLRFVKRYKGVRLGILAPHVFSVAEQAYNDMIERKKNQSVLVSGESGAGKTMSTKYILRYLSDRTGKQSKIDEMVIASVPILEALGNAKTLRNDNSSRFGKFIEVQFDEDYTIAGSKTIPYLLEKSRITNHQNGERDFHIFYQLTEGMPKERQKLFKLGPATQFKYLVKTPDQAKFITIDGVDDAKEFQDFEKALEIFEVYEEVRNNIYRVISAVLWFGNVEYKAIGDKAALKDAESEQALKNAAELLSVDYEKLQWGLTNKKIKAMKEVIDKPLTATEAKDMTDAVAKHIYSVLFEWLVEILNAGTACEHYISFIGVLDIFGFEVFELNSMEQFLINYTNERLQQFFNHYIFKLEQAEYEREQIDWTVIQFKDNQDTLDLIESKRPPGIISLLDEESKFPKATDDSLIEKLHTNLDKNPLYGKPRLQRRKFSVKHYAGVVEYEVSGWRDRNRDELPPLLVEALQGSNNQFMAILFTEDDEDRLLPVLMEREKRAFDEVGDGKEASPKANRRISFARGGGSALRKNAAGQEKKAAAEQGSAATKITLATQFKQQLLDLMTMLGSTDPFFIRCIKPNEHKKQDDFDQELIYNQLLYAGMLETIRIRRMGYPVRYIHRDFWKRFRVICPEVNPIDDMKQLSKNLAIALGLNIPGETQVGLTKVVLKQHTANELEDRRAIALTSTIIKMQTWWRWAFYRSKFINDRENAILLEAWWRYTRKRKVFLRQRRGACSIGQWWRMVQAIKAKKKLAEEKRKKEEEKRRKEEEARKKRIEKYGLDQVLAEEEAERKGEIDKLRELAAGAVPKEKKKKKKKKTRLERSSSIIMEKMEEVEIPINVDSKIVLGLGWKGRTAGLDASVIIFRYQQHRDDVYYYKPRSNDGAIMHRGGYQGMIRRGLEEGQTNDAEQIEINLNKVTPKANTIIVVVTVFDGDFSSTTDAYIRLLDDASGHEYARFTLQDAGSETARIMCKLTRQGHTRWRLKALGEPSQGRVFKHMITKVRPFLDEEPPKTKMTINVKEGEFKLRQTESRRRPTKSYKQLALYAEVYYDTEKEKTKSVKASPDKTMKPKWDQQRVLTGCSNYIEVAIFNNRGRFGGGQFLGRVVIDLGEKGEANDEWFDVEKPDEGVRSTYVEGKLRLSYSRV